MIRNFPLASQLDLLYICSRMFVNMYIIMSCTSILYKATCLIKIFTKVNSGTLYKKISLLNLRNYL